MTKYLACALMSMLFAAMACSEPVTVEMVVGEYVANHGLATDTIAVRSDGTYRYYYKEPGGEEFTNENHWELEDMDGRPMLTFSKFDFKLPGYGLGPGYWIVEVERTLSGRIRLCIDPDLGYYYIKADPQEN